MGCLHTNIHINTYDIETYTENDKVYPYCICYILNDKNFYIYSNEKNDIIYQSIKNIVFFTKKKKIIFYIHNLNFDGFLILESLFNNNIIFKIIKKELNIYKISFLYMETEIIFKCSYKLLPLSLRQLSFNYEIEKGVFPYKFASFNNLNYIGNCPSIEYFEKKEDYLYFKDKIFDFKKESISYCLNDVVVLKRILEEIFLILKNINLDFIKILNKINSIPSFSHNVYFKYYNFFNVENKLSLDVYSYIKNSYYGGRTEVFGNIEEKEIIHYFDFTGMYSQCMQERFPTHSCYFDVNISNFNRSGFYYIIYEQCDDFPILPIKKDNKLLFVNGILEGLYWNEEILLFIKNKGKIISCKYAILYNFNDFIFKKFIDDFSKLREKGGYWKILGKLIINSLYGSFGLKKEDVFSKITYSEKEFIDISENLNIRSFTKINNCYMIEIYIDSKSNKILNKEEKNWSNFFHQRNVAYASIIASKARIKLYNAFLDVISNNGRLLYCDTDSIFASFKDNKLNQNCGKDIKWSNIYYEGVFILPKFYGLIDKDKEIIKIKGISNNIKYEILKKNFYNNLNFIFQNENVFYKKNYILKQKFIEKIVWIDKYDKRVFTNNKKRTTPLWL